LGNEHEVFKFQARGDDVLAQESQVITIGMPDFFDKTMQTQLLQQARDLPAGLFPQMGAQGFVLQAAQVELSPGQGFHQGLVGGGEEVQSPIRAVVLPDGLRDFADDRSQRTDPPGWR